MVHIPVSRNAEMVIEAMKSATNIGEALYVQLVMRSEQLSENDVFDIVSYYRSDAVVIEAVLRSAILSREAACKLLGLFKFNRNLCNISELSYDDQHFSDLLEKEQNTGIFSRIFN